MKRNTINGMRLWLCRDSFETGDGEYKLFAGKERPILHPDYGHWWQGEYDLRCILLRQLCMEYFHKVFPDVRLRPGEGPIEVSIDIREIK